ncbi:hypothetical protein Lsed01_01341 [Demequina sediminis]|uniref:Uncharacterized protein n=1 Tax=Demequina sediminis TaxID=1930058 RepID=A0ABP9WGE6_9MICO
MDTSHVIITDGSDLPSREESRGVFAYTKRLVLERRGH